MLGRLSKLLDFAEDVREATEEEIAMAEAEAAAAAAAMAEEEAEADVGGDETDEALRGEAQGQQQQQQQQQQQRRQGEETGGENGLVDVALEEMEAIDVGVAATPTATPTPPPPTRRAVTFDEAVVEVEVEPQPPQTQRTAETLLREPAPVSGEAVLHVPADLLTAIESPDAAANDTYDAALLALLGVDIPAPRAEEEPPVSAIPEPVSEGEREQDTTPTPNKAQLVAEEKLRSAMKRVEALETDLELRRAESIMLRVGARPSPLSSSSSSSLGWRSPAPKSSPLALTAQAQHNSTDVLHHCARLVSRLGGDAESARKTAERAGMAGSALLALSARVADAEARAAAANKRAEEAEATNAALKNMVVTFLERGSRKDALDVLARALNLDPAERKRVGLDGGVLLGSSARTVGSFATTLSDFVRDEVS